MYFCKNVSQAVNWFINVLNNVVKQSKWHVLELLSLNLPSLNTKERNTCLILLATYIDCVWQGRKNKVFNDSLVKLIRGRILLNHFYIKKILGNGISCKFSKNYCAMKI